MANIIVCSAADVDYTESLTWYAEHSNDAANDFDAEFDRALKQIAETPERFPLCDSRHRYFLLRRFRFGSSIALFTMRSSLSPWLTVPDRQTTGQTGNRPQLPHNACRVRWQYRAIR